MFLCFWFISFSIISSRFTHVVTNDNFVFHSGFTSAWFPLACTRTPFSPYPHQHFLLIYLFFDNNYPNEVRWYLSVVLICSLVISDYWVPFHISVCHLYVFLGEVSIQALCPFLSRVVCLFILLLNCKTRCRIFRVLIIWISDIFSHYIGCVFTLLFILPPFFFFFLFGIQEIFAEAKNLPHCFLLRVLLFQVFCL